MEVVFADLQSSIERNSVIQTIGFAPIRIRLDLVRSRTMIKVLADHFPMLANRMIDKKTGRKVVNALHPWCSATGPSTGRSFYSETASPPVTEPSPVARTPLSPKLLSSCSMIAPNSTGSFAPNFAKNSFWLSSSFFHSEATKA